jgi:Ca2+/Na+ antiporter
MGAPGDSPFPWIAVALIIVAFAFGFCAGMYLCTAVIR